MANIASEKEKLEAIELQYVATVKELEACTDPDQSELLHQRNMDEQDAVDNQKFLVDNLEFQQLEVCAKIASMQPQSCVKLSDLVVRAVGCSIHGT